MLSVGYGELGNDAQAIAEAQTFLTFAQKNQNLLWEKSALNLLGDLHKKFGCKEQAMVAYQLAKNSTLSACQTALANRQQDGIEIASLAYYFLNGGAKAVLASLWQVNDPSTKDLMEHFYQNLAQNPQITKAEALRLAQLSLLCGKQVTLDDIKRGAIDVEPVPGKPSKQTSTRANFSHPYYWAPFILIGNGL